ncbi:hypothetical protein SAMN05443144_1481 [Fodinibius roseus]|uniref:Uncharacterized protein n=1 Tax=Fodinibius roseus TaxID=1194090 RepID=A0A1M5LZR2_9BACT|nr:hypothetical protein SAMN05443144_1481 [Fodinibius roseus]
MYLENFDHIYDRFLEYQSQKNRYEKDTMDYDGINSVVGHAGG